MIDTISIKHELRGLSEHRLIEIGATFKAGRRNPTWYLNPGYEGVLPRITISKTPDAIYHVYAECSIPVLLYGHNARLPESEDEIARGLGLICANVESRLDIEYDADSVIISKVHLTRDYRLGDAANQAVFALFDKRLRYFPKRNITAAEGHAITLYFNYASRRRNCVICIYPKYADVLASKGSQEALDAAQGILRIEYRANTRAGVSSLQDRFEAKKPRELLTRELNDRVFQSLEAELHFPECIDNPQSPLTKLLAMYSDRKAERLCGFLEKRKLKGDLELNKSDRERRNFNAARRDCERAGVWLDLRHSEE